MKILSTFKKDRISIYSVSKTQKFWKKARELLDKLKVSSGGDFFGFKVKDDYRKKEININSIKDTKLQGFNIDNNSGVDFIFGNNKIFIIFSYNKDMQKKFSKIMNEVFK